MKTVKQSPLREDAEGYWAVEIRLSDTNAVRPRYLCHASNDADAKRIAGDLMGPTAAVHGYGYFHLELPISGRKGALPVLGAWEAVTAEGWSNLMLAHAASEAAAAKRKSRAQ